MWSEKRGQFSIVSVAEKGLSRGVRERAWAKIWRRSSRGRERRGEDVIVWAVVGGLVAIDEGPTARSEGG